MNTPCYSNFFHFTLGPVQGFVAQARRTRDFWAGSFILSWLSAVAMKSVEQQKGEIIFPLPDETFMKALETGQCNLKQGNNPNRFKAGVFDGFNPRAVVEDVRHAWFSLAEHVYCCDLDTLVSQKTRDIWKRQVENFWDISWALTETEDHSDSSIIDRLKNWRIHLPPDEPGMKCMMMEGMQELSGVLIPHSEGLKIFWDKIRNSEHPGMQTDLREKEHLCAIAFIKRRFARHFITFRTIMPGGWQLKGWLLPKGVPSVHYMAAAPWLAKLIKKANSESDVYKEMWHLHDVAKKLTGHCEWESNIRCIREATETSAQNNWKALDGTIFFDSMLENTNLWDDKQQNQAEKILKQLIKVREIAKMEPVSPFYAVLLMDGDQLGIHMSDRDKQKDITESLAKFTVGVQSIVEKNNGFLIYAGGDDVLAIFPLEDVLSCAVELRAHYLRCFESTKIPTSLSGAVEFAHIKMPLGKVLHDAHDLLDNVAKEGRGRDAIACRVWKPGGLTVEWAMPWLYALNGSQSCIIEDLADKLKPSLEDSDRQNQMDDPAIIIHDHFAGKFFFKIKQLFTMLNPQQCAHYSASDLFETVDLSPPLLDQKQADALMAAEYLNSGSTNTCTLIEAKSIISPLLEQCRPVIRDQNKEKSEWKKSSYLIADGALLVRFLAQKGVER